jgi:hypothetical protein
MNDRSISFEYEKKLWDAENTFYLQSKPSRIGKFLYHYEIYKKILDIPGDVLEFGVFKGASFSRFLSFRRILENDDSRRIVGFDDFGAFTAKGKKDDIRFAKKFKKTLGLGSDHIQLKNNFQNNGYSNFELIKGDVVNTLPHFLKKNSGAKISLLHLDLDVYRPTKFVLGKLFKKLSSGGIILIDDYGEISGATDAIDEFFSKKNFKIEKMKFYKRPSYIVIN